MIEPSNTGTEPAVCFQPCNGLVSTSDRPHRAAKRTGGRLLGMSTSWHEGCQEKNKKGPGAIVKRPKKVNSQCPQAVMWYT